MAFSKDELPKLKCIAYLVKEGVPFADVIVMPDDELKLFVIAFAEVNGSKFNFDTDSFDEPAWLKTSLEMNIDPERFK